MSGAGKSTLAELVVRELQQRDVKVEVLDGDVIRTNLSKGLTFSKEDRDINIRRIGFVCNLLTRNGLCAIAAAISPYRAVRDENRALIGENFVGDDALHWGYVTGGMIAECEFRGARSDALDIDICVVGISADSYEVQIAIIVQVRYCHIMGAIAFGQIKWSCKGAISIAKRNRERAAVPRGCHDVQIAVPVQVL